jgi:predicted lactoylglutathione lyase
VPTGPVVVALPTADRPTTHAFYRDGLGFETIGELADDGVPEPLQFVVNEGLRLMFIPTGGFGWSIGEHEVAPQGTSECLLSLSVAADDEVDAAVDLAAGAGATVVAPPARQPWGYTATFADPDGHLWQVLAVPPES